MPGHVRRRARSTKRQGWRPSWTLLLATLPVITLVLTLMGYGYSFGYLATFDLYPHTLQHGPLDFLLRSVLAVAAIAEKSTQLKDWLFTADGLARIWEETAWRRHVVGVGIGCLVLAMILIASPRLQPIRTFMSESMRRDHPALRFVKACWTRARNAVSKEMAFFLGMTFAGWIATPILAFVVLAALWLLSCLFIVLVASIPLMVIADGRQSAMDHVITPAACHIVQPDGQTTKAGAPCVKVLKDGKEIARGRLIDHNPERMWLLTKHPWKISSVPIEGAAIESANSDGSVRDGKRPVPPS